MGRTEREALRARLEAVRYMSSAGWSLRWLTSSAIDALLPEVEALIAEARADERQKADRRVEIERRAYDRLQLCSDHRDKANGRCLVCVAEERTRREVNEAWRRREDDAN